MQHPQIFDNNQDKGINIVDQHIHLHVYLIKIYQRMVVLNFIITVTSSMKQFIPFH